MNRTRLLMIGALALAVGAFVSLLVYRSLQAKGSSGGEPGVDAVVAARDIQIGTKIGTNDVTLAKFPPTSLPNGFYKSSASVQGRGVIIPISRGEFILPTKLAAENGGSGLQSLIPNGMRAMSVRVNDVVAVAGFVAPGTRVDVLMTGVPTGGTEQQTTTVLQNVPVIAVGQKLERTSTGDPQNAGVITLLVTPEDAQKLTLASSGGHIQLALRNPLDTKQDTVPGFSSKGLYHGETAAPIPTPVHVAHVAKKKPEPAPQPTLPSSGIEVIQGNKPPVTVTFSDENPGAK